MLRKRTLPFLLIAVLVLTVGSKAAFALGGCVDSPEDPTAILAILGCGAAAIPILRSKMQARKRIK
jgi:XrtJ-associated TM-motif-TM protein